MLTFPCQSRAVVKHQPKDVRLGFTLGAVSRHGCRGPLLSKWTKNLPRFTKLLASFGRRNTDDSFNFTAIQVNKNNETALHVDRNNLGPSHIVGLGEYGRGRRGVGDFWVQGMELNSPGSSLPTRNEWIKFDGKVPHGTLWEPCSQEMRFTLVYYAHKVCLQPDLRGILQRLCNEYHFRADVEKLRLLCDGAPVPAFPAAWGPQASGEYPSRQVRVGSARNAFEAAGGKVADLDVDDYGSDTGSDPDSDCPDTGPESEPATSLQTLRQEIERLEKLLTDLNAEVEQLGVEIWQGKRETSIESPASSFATLSQKHRQKELKKEEIAASEAELEKAHKRERRLLRASELQALE